MKIIFLFCLLPGILTAADFFDDFESYTPGDDLADSADWYSIDPSGDLIVTEEGSNTIVESLWNGYDDVTYACLGAADWSDGMVSADLMFRGEDVMYGLPVRMNSSTGECYMGCLYAIYPPYGSTLIMHIDENGVQTILDSDPFHSQSPDTWYHVSFEVTGNDPVSLKFSVNGTMYSEFQDDTYKLGPGLSGLWGFSGGILEGFYADDFDVDDYSAAMASTTFGAIKALFR